MLISTLFQPTVPLVDGVILSLVNVPTSVVFCIFFIYVNRNLISLLSFLMPLYWLYKCLGSARQISISSKNHWFLIVLVNYMMINICLKTATFFYQRIYLISAMTSSTLLTLSIFFTPFILFILFILPTFLILCFFTLGTKECNIMAFIYLEISNFRRPL